MTARAMSRPALGHAQQSREHQTESSALSVQRVGEHRNQLDRALRRIPPPMQNDVSHREPANYRTTLPPASRHAWIAVLNPAAKLLLQAVLVVPAP